MGYFSSFTYSQKMLHSIYCSSIPPLPIPENYQKECSLSYFFPSHLFTFHSLVQSLLPTVKLNRVDQPVSREHKMVHSSPLYANTIKCSSNSLMKTPICFCHFYLVFVSNGPQTLKAFYKSTTPMTTKT